MCVVGRSGDAKTILTVVASESAFISINPFMPSIPIKGTFANSVDPNQALQNAASGAAERGV